MRLFGTSGIRGDAQTLFTDQFCFDLGRTFALFLKNHNVAASSAVGMDPRPSSQRIKKAFSSGLTFENFKVFDEGIIPVPAMNYLTGKTEIKASAMVTGSHIKADLNGLKFFMSGEEILKNHEEKMTEIYEIVKEKERISQAPTDLLSDNRADKLYRQLLFDLASKPYPAWRIVVDPGNGAQSKIIPEILSELGLSVILVNTSMDENFLARDTEVEKDFEDFKKRVLAEKADFGAGFDADGDRLALVDKNGLYIPGDYIGAIIAKEEESETLVTPISVSQVIDQIHKQVVRTKVGSPFVIEKMKETGASFGFEANGGCIFAKYNLTRDAGLAIITILNILKEKNKSLIQLFGELPRYFIFRDKVDCPWEFEQKVLEEARRMYTGRKTEEIDGLKIWVEEKAWILFRSSKNAPEFRVFAEDVSQESAIKLGQDGLQLVKEVISK